MDENPRALPLASLANQCAQQTLRFFQRVESDTRFCFEIFRRAIVEKDQQAWDLIHQLYSDQLLRWVRRHPRFSACVEDEVYFANRALEKFWQALAPDQFARFPELKHLLSYLQMCVYSAINDHLRVGARARLETDLEEAENEVISASSEDSVLVRSQARDLWAAITARLRDQKEIRVAYDSFVLGLKPGDMLERYPGFYESIKEIYRIKESILDRLRRDAELLAWVSTSPESNA